MIADEANADLEVQWPDKSRALQMAWTVRKCESLIDYCPCIKGPLFGERLNVDGDR